MSYDISFKVKFEGVDAYVEVGNCQANTTWNARKMIEVATGLPWINFNNNGLCADVMPHIQKGYEELTKHPKRYKQYEASNGWGTVESTAAFFQDILDAWAELITWHEELVPVATFWIE